MDVQHGSQRQMCTTKPVLGMTLAFRSTGSESLADIPARVIYIWPRFRSGDYLVTLEYARPVWCGNQLISQIDAFASELYQPRQNQPETRRFNPGHIRSDQSTQRHVRRTA